MLGTLTILGPGLLGGSIGLAARHRRVARQVVIWARRLEAAEQAVAEGAADRVARDLPHAVEEADLVVLAVPIGAMLGLVEQFKPGLPAQAVVTDVGSVKYPVVNALTHALAGRAHFVGSHPMAGSEQAGFDAARRDLLDNAVCIVTPRPDTDPAALRRVYDFWRALGCRVASLSPEQHDEVVARVSHLPHMVAAALVNVVCRDGGQALRYSGPGFRDTTRVAAGPADMWTEICVQNKEEIGRALDELIEELGKLRAAIHNADAIELRAMLKRAKHYRDELRFQQ